MTWSSMEAGVLARAVARAPSVDDSKPWAVELRPDGADLLERSERPGPRHDPTGRDRMISCGAALTDLELAARALGRRTRVALFPDAARPHLVARLVTDGPVPATETEVDRYTAIFRRRSYRAPFGLRPLPGPDVDALVAADAVPGTEIRPVRPHEESGVLAETLGRAGRVLRGDQACRRELAAWSARFRDPLPGAFVLSWSGFAGAGTELPDGATLTQRLMRERLLIVLTTGDTRRDQLLAGQAMQQVWLTAVTRRLAASVLTQPLHLPEERANLIHRLDLRGYPQVILRAGYPVTAIPATAPPAAMAERTAGD